MNKLLALHETWQQWYIWFNGIQRRVITVNCRSVLTYIWKKCNGILEIKINSRYVIKIYIIIIQNGAVETSGNTIYIGKETS